MEEIVIRPYQKEDRQEIRNIAWATAFFGQPASAFFDGKEIFSSFLTEYFTDYEPESSFVAVKTDGKVIGYLLGAKDNAVAEKTFMDKIFLPLLRKAFFSGVFSKRKNINFFFRSLLSLLRREFKLPDIHKEYPATLHINIDQAYRNLKIGSRLITAYQNYLLREGITGVYLATLSDKASGFFSAQGFNLLHKGRRSYFRHILNKDTPIYIYGKKLQ